MLGLRTANVNRFVSGTVWEVRPKRVKVSYMKTIGSGRIQSTAGHEKPCGKSGGPPPKAEYSLVTDRAEYCEGKVKRTPGGE